MIQSTLLQKEVNKLLCFIFWLILIKKKSYSLLIVILVYYFNYELEDYSATNMDTILDMVKVFAFAVTEGKVRIFYYEITS